MQLRFLAEMKKKIQFSSLCPDYINHCKIEYNWVWDKAPHQYGGKMSCNINCVLFSQRLEKQRTAAAYSSALLAQTETEQEQGCHLL